MDTVSSGIYVWMGKKSTAQEKVESLERARVFIRENDYPAWTRVRTEVRSFLEISNSVCTWNFHRWSESRRAANRRSSNNTLTVGKTTVCCNDAFVSLVDSTTFKIRLVLNDEYYEVIKLTTLLFRVNITCCDHFEGQTVFNLVSCLSIKTFDPQSFFKSTTTLKFPFIFFETYYID